MKFLSKLFYILCIPSFLLNSLHASLLQTTSSLQETAWDVPLDEFGNVNPWVLLQGENLSIDRYFSFVELSSNEVFLETLSEEEFDRTVEFMTAMLRLGAPESLEDLVEAYDQDIEELLDDLYGDPKWELAYSHGSDFQFAPAVFYADSFRKAFLCKNWFKRKAHHFGHWCKKHKKPLIAGAVVVGVVAIAVATGGVGGSSAAAVGGALINDTYSGEDRPKHINKPGEVCVDNGIQETGPTSPYHPTTESIPVPSSQPNPIEQAHTLSFEKVEEAKFEIAEKTYIEEAKDVTKVTVSNIVHEVFESLSKVGKAWHEINPNSTPEDIQTYKEFVATQHEKIDKIFGTNRPDYSIESQEYAAAYKAAIIEELGYYPEMQMGELPPPGALISAVSRAAAVASRALGVAAKSGSAIGTVATVSSLLTQTAPSNISSNGMLIEQLSEAGKVDDRGGLTRAGRGLQKHGGRSDSVFPKPSGNISQINAQGQQMLEGILNSPNNEVIELPNGSTKIYAQNGRGVHFDRKGNFIGFVEKQYE